MDLGLNPALPGSRTLGTLVSPSLCLSICEMVLIMAAPHQAVLKVHRGDGV